MKITIALFGPIASGKGEVANLLSEKGFTHFTFRDTIHAEIVSRGLSLERNTFQTVAQSLRKEQGYDMQARSIGKLIEQKRLSGEAEKAIIDGLRHPADVIYLKKFLNAHIVGVVAPPDLRFQRLLDRGRFSDPTDRALFDHADRRDRGIGQAKEADHIDECIEMADTIIENTRDKKFLSTRVNELLSTYGIEGNQRHIEKG